MNDVLKSLADLSNSGRLGALCTIIRCNGSTPRKEGSKMLVYPDGSIVGSIGGGEVESRVIQEAIETLNSGQSRVVEFNLVDPAKGDPGVCGGTLEVFVDPLGKREKIIVVGGGHVGRAVVHLAKWLGFHVTLTDDREEYCRPEGTPGADEYIHCKFEDLSNYCDISEETALVLATRTNQLDVSGLPEILSKPVGYIGVISSGRRWKLTEDQLIKSGVKKDRIQMVHAPIGLDIKAETPEEIAISIMAEIIQVKRDGTKLSLSK